MKQKRTYVTVLLVVALLALGVAYAALGPNAMKVTTGVATTVGGTMDVEISEVTVDKNGTASAGDGLSATLNVTGLQAAGDTATATVTFTNNQAGVPAKISLVDVKTSDNKAWANTDWLKIEASEVEYTGGSVPTNGTATATITVTLLKTPGTAADEAKATVSGVTVNYKAEAVDQ